MGIVVNKGRTQSVFWELVEVVIVVVSVALFRLLYPNSYGEHFVWEVLSVLIFFLTINQIRWFLNTILLFVLLAITEIEQTKILLLLCWLHVVDFIIFVKWVWLSVYIIIGEC